MPDPAFGRRVRALRLARGLDQRSLAERVEARMLAQGGRGFDVTYLSKIENARLEPPSTLAILALAEELGADPFELVALGGHVPPAVSALFVASQGARRFFRAAVELGLADDDWRHLAEEAQQLHS